MKQILLYPALFVLLIASSAAVVCTDTDGANNFNQAGLVELAGRTYVDSCQGNKAIDYRCAEEYTQDGIKHHAQKSIKECPNDCMQGACMGAHIESLAAPSQASNSLTGNVVDSSASSSGQGGIVLLMFITVAGLALYTSLR